jgi:hypothetical protein
VSTPTIPGVARSSLGTAGTARPRSFTPLYVLVTLLSGLLFYVFTTHGTFDPYYEQPEGGFAGRFYFAQAQALVHGHLNVPPSQLPSECWVHLGRCYGYFGLTASILRVPLLPLMNSTNRGLTAVYMALALTLAVGSAVAVASLVLATTPRTPLLDLVRVVLVVSLGPASVILMTARPAVYEEAIAWSVGFGVLAIFCFLRWWKDRNWGWALMVPVTLVLSASARPTTVALGAALGAGMIISAVLQRHAHRRVWLTCGLGVAVGALPFAVCVGVYWLKFHTLVPNPLLNQQIGGPLAAPWWVAIRRIDHNSLQGFRFLPTALVAFLRPDGVHFVSAVPFVQLRLGPAPGPGVHYLLIPPGSDYVEPFSTLPDDMPLFALALLAVLLHAIHRVWRRRSPVRDLVFGLLGSPSTYAIVGAAGSAAVMMTQGGISNRYLADFFPLVAVALPSSVRVLEAPMARLRGGWALAIGSALVVLLLWSLLANIGLEYQLWWHATAS